MVLLDKDGVETLLVIIKGSYVLESNRLTIAEEQVPIVMADEFYGEPGQSSIKYQSDLVLSKKGTDIVLLGNAYAQRRKTKIMDVQLKVDNLVKTIKVIGDRTWQKILGLHYISDPVPFEKIPLVYERSFGGEDRSNPNPQKQDYEARNPIGTGYRSKFTKDIEGVKLPNFEDPRKLIKSWKDHPTPTGFGLIGREWEPRRKYAGTYDENWGKNRSPLLPIDFDEYYFNGAHPSLVVNGFLKGNEMVECKNLSASGNFRFQLPGVVPQIDVIVGNERKSPLVFLDSLIIEPDCNRAVLVWRGTVNINRRLYDVKSIEIPPIH